MVRHWFRHLFGACSGTRGARRRPGRPRVELLEDRTLLAAALVADINPSVSGSHPSGFVGLNGAAYFFADDGLHGVELWTSDGSPGGTRLVKDINPGSGSSSLPVSPSPVVLGSALYFFADDGVHGPQLWKSNGSAVGTTALSPPAPGAVSYATQVAAADGLIFFADPSTGELWKTDGTPGHTAPVTDRTGNPITSPFDLTNVGGTLYFAGTQAGTGSGLWKTDGTPGGTTFLQSVGGAVSDLTGVAGTAYFVVSTAAGNGQQDVALWKSDLSGTGLVHDFGTVASPAAPLVADLTAFNGRLYFAADDRTASPDQGVELWTSDGTGAGTHMVTDINPGGSALGAGADLTAFRGNLYFTADDGSGPALWRTDGSTGGTAKVLDNTGNPVPGGGILSADPGTTLYFAGSNGGGSGLWRTDGTALGTVLVRSLPAVASGPGSSAVANGTLFFAADDGTHGSQLWTSDGSGAGTGMVVDLTPSASSDPEAITDVNGTAFFMADDGVHGTELWRSDGTAAGTALVKDIAPGSLGGLGLAGPARLLNANGTLFFFAYDGNPADGTVQLWKSNGSDAGTQLVKGFTPAQAGPFGFLYGLPDTLTNVNGEVFFVADDGTHGLELWKSDGTPGGTAMVQDLNPGPWGSDPAGLTAAGGNLFFTASDGTRTGLWKTDGSAVTFLAAGASNLASVGGSVYFTAADPANLQNGPALWKTDGTTTAVVKDLGQGTSARLLTAVNGSLAFVVDGPGGETLWASDGTGPGTGPLHSFSGSQPLSEPTAVGSTLYFIDAGSNGPELWKSDGTAGGTVRVAGLTSSLGFFGLTNVNGTLVFAASDPTRGQELWTSNGTLAGTSFAQDLNPGGGSSSPHGFAAVGGKLFFAANDGSHGIELFADTGSASRTATTTVLGASPNPVTVGQAVTLTAQVTPAQGLLDGGAVMFFDGSVQLGTVGVGGGGLASLPTSLGAGLHLITAVYTGDPSFSGSASSPVAVVVLLPGQTRTTTTLIATPTTATPAQLITFTATVKPPVGNVDGGRVDFMDGATDLGSVAVGAGGVATLSTALADGTHKVVAVYQGDPSFGPSVSDPPATVTVSEPVVTTTTLTVVPDTTVNQGDPVTFTAQAAPAQGNVDGGTIDFMDGQTDLGTVAVDGNGVARLTRVLPVGTHDIVAVYSGHAAFGGSASAPVTVTVSQPAGAADTTTTLTASDTAVTPDDPVTFTAKASPAQGSVDGGMITFMDGQDDLGEVAVDAEGVARLTLELAIGIHDVVAVYSGNAHFNGSTSATVEVTVAAAGASDDTTTLTVPSTTVTEGDPVTFTATVTSAQGAVDGGSVDFRNGQQDLGKVPLGPNGVARLTLELSAGHYNVVAVYSGDAHFKPTRSDPVAVTVNPATGAGSTVTTLIPSALLLNGGQQITLVALVNGTPGATPGPVDGGSVMFLDGGTALATVPVEPGTGRAVLTTVLDPGLHTLTAVYQGDTRFAPSTSIGVTVKVEQPPLMGDVTPLVQTTLTPAPGGGKSRGFVQILSLLNVGGLQLQGPLFVVVHGLRSGVTLRGASGFVRRGKKKMPFVVVNPGDGIMHPNDSLLAALRFSARPNRFTLSISAGFPSA
jgi:ELWxxDGT repeat protein